MTINGAERKLPMAGKSLRDRCKEILDQIQQDALLRQHSSVDTLMAFVQTEVGRTADPLLGPSQPLVLYFPTVEDREQFIQEVRSIHPGWSTRKMP